MSFLKKLGKSNDIKEETDTLGGGAKDSAVYDCTIQAAYLGVSKGGANSLTIVAKDDETGHEFRETLWVTNKKGEEFYEYNGEKRFLPGYNVANAIAALSTGYELSDLDDPEERTLKVYDFDEGKEVSKQFDCLVQLHGEKIKLGILKQIEDKTKLSQSTGEYEPTGETREVNVIDKVFHQETGRTLQEVRADKEEAVFLEKWANKWTGKERNKAKGAASTGKAGAPAGGGTKPTTSLFNKK